MVKVVQEIRPLSVKESHQLIEAERASDLARRLRPRIWWLCAGWALLVAALINSGIILVIGTHYQNWWLASNWDLQYLTAAGTILVFSLPLMFALMCFQLGKTAGVTARNESIQLNLTEAVNGGLYKFLSGSKEEYLRHKGCLESAQALKHEGDESLRVIREVEALILDILHVIDQGGGLVRIGQHREVLAAANVLIEFLTHNRMDEYDPKNEHAAVYELHQKIRHVLNPEEVAAE